MLHTIRHLHGKEVHAAHREKEQEGEREERGGTVMTSKVYKAWKIQDTTNHRNYLTALFVLLLQERVGQRQNRWKDREERRQSKARQWRIHDRRSGRSWNVLEKQSPFHTALSTGTFFTLTNLRLPSVALANRQTLIWDVVKSELSRKVKPELSNAVWKVAELIQS